MNPSAHTMHELFAQLGLPNDEADIQAFVTAHPKLAPGTLLADAPYWTPPQAQFLRDQLRQDADWAEVVDQLNLMLH